METEKIVEIKWHPTSVDVFYGNGCYRSINTEHVNSYTAFMRLVRHTIGRKVIVTESMKQYIKIDSHIHLYR